MWEAIGNALTSENATSIFVTFIILAIVFFIAVKFGWVKVKTSCLSIGDDERERNIIRQQVEWAHIFITSLSGKITADNSKFNGYFTKYILECVFDEVVDWITFNHLNTSSAYIQIKQDKICALVYSMNVREEFKSPEFHRRMCAWTKEVIEKLVQIREVYK